MTLVLTDVPDAAQRWGHDPDATASLLRELDELVARVVEEAGGVVVKPRGENESHFAAFAEPAAGVAAARSLLVAARCLGLDLRAAVHTAPLEVRDGDYYGIGVNECARLRSAGHAGQVLCSDVVAAAAGSGPTAALGGLWLKDLPRPLRAHRLTGDGFHVDDPPKQVAPPSHRLPIPATTLVGRGALVQEVAGLLRARRPVILTGAAGVGKSRVAFAVAARLHDAGEWVGWWRPDDDGCPVPSPAEGALEALGPGDVAVLDDLDAQPEHAAQMVKGLDSRGVIVLATARSFAPLDGEVREVPALDRDQAAALLADRVAVAPTDPDELLSQLAGNPVLIEAAASRLRLMTPAQLAQRMAANPDSVLTNRSAFLHRHGSPSAMAAWPTAGPEA